MEQITNLVQLPAIVDKNGKIIHQHIDMLRLSDAELKSAATFLGGRLVYLWMRATYTELETRLCSFKGCSAKAREGSLWCQRNGHA